jgi:transposase InsO family protein
MHSAIVNACKSFFHQIKTAIKQFSKPETAVLATGTASDVTRSRKDLIAENAIFRQQLIVLKRQVKRPKFSKGDRLRVEPKTPFQAPKANAHCERLIGTMKRECLDHFLILNQYQLKRIITAFAGYYNQHRPHQGIEQRIPAKLSQPRPQLSNQVKGKVLATPMLNGLHHSYAYATC